MMSYIVIPFPLHSQADRVGPETAVERSSAGRSAHSVEGSWTKAHRCPQLYVCVLCSE